MAREREREFPRVNGKKVNTLKSKRLRSPVDLQGLPFGTFNVAITAKLTNGKTLRYTRKYRTCQPKLPPSNNLEGSNAV